MHRREMFPLHSVLLVLILTLLGLPAGCVTTQETLPVITPDAGHLRLTGKFVWFDLYTTDMTAVQNFYGRVFNWSLERSDERSARIKNILLGDMRIGNIFGIEPGQGGSRWVPCLSVPDAASAYDRAVQNGATGDRPGEMPYRGLMAEVRDPMGAAVALLESSVGDPPDRQLIDGYWLGAELWTGDVERARGFYAGLVGYEDTSMIQSDGRPYVLLVSSGRPRGGVTAPPVPDAAPQWVPQVSVLDLDRTLDLVEQYGGTVLVRPGRLGSVEGVAVFADPTGALMGIREFVKPED